MSKSLKLKGIKLPSLIVEKRAVEDQYIMRMRPFASFIFTLIVLAIFLFPFGVNPFDLIISLIIKPLATPYGWTNILLKLIPLLLCGLGLIIAFKANLWNIGANGQLLLGAIAATGIALFILPNAPSYIVIPVMFISGFIAGGIWALIPAYLKAKFDVNEVLTTLMMNYIAVELVNFLIFGPWQGKNVYNYPITDLFPPNAQIPVISPRYPLHYPTLILSILLIPLVYIMITRTKFGYELRVYGSNPDAAMMYGIKRSRVILLSMFLSGGLAGLAGVGEVAGIHHRLFNPTRLAAGYGFTAILVAWLANLNPLVVFFSAFLMGLLITGTRFLQASSSIPFGVVNVIIGTMLTVLTATELFVRYRIKIIWGDE